MAADLERVRGAIAWGSTASVPDTRLSNGIGTMRCWFDLGTAASVACMALLPPHPGALVALELFALGRLLLVSWVPPGD